MEFTRIGQRMRRAGLAVLAAAISAKAGIVPYASNVPPLPYSIGGLTVNGTGDPALPQMTFIPPVENLTTQPPDVKTGIFPDACRTCSTQASSTMPLLSPSIFALVINSVIAEVTGTVAAPSNASGPYQAASASSVYWLPPPTPVATETLNAGSGTFISEVTGSVVTPSNATTPYQEASTASVTWLPNFGLRNFVPEVTPHGGTANPGTGSPNPASDFLLASTIPINPLIPIAPPISGPYLSQVTIQGVVYQNTALPLVNGVPEPAPFSLIGLALLGLSIWRASGVQDRKPDGLR